MCDRGLVRSVRLGPDQIRARGRRGSGRA
jgi:hypothetical protein